MFDNTFSVGSEIYATWTNSNKIYLTKVKIIKENKKTWVIEVISPIKNTDTIFKEKYPNVTVNVVSNKKERNEKNKGKPWKNREW